MADDILKVILDNELLTDDVRSQISEAFEKAINEAKTIASAKAKAELEAEKEQAITEAREAVEIEVRADLATKFVEEREELAKALDEKVSELLAKEMEELKEDIMAFRNLEVEKALELEEEKERLAEQFATERESLIVELDKFVETRLAAEMEELAEDIKTVKENTFGRQVYEAFAQCYHESFINEGALGPDSQEKIREAEEAKEVAENHSNELEEQIAQMLRDRELEKTLAPLSGKRRAVMETILERQETEKFLEVYERMLPKVLSTVGTGSETVTEGKKEEVTENTPPAEEEGILNEAPEGTVLVTGDEVVTEDAIAVEADAGKKEEEDALRRLAGITK